MLFMGKNNSNLNTLYVLMEFFNWYIHIYRFFRPSMLGQIWIFSSGIGVGAYFLALRIGLNLSPEFSYRHINTLELGKC